MVPCHSADCEEDTMAQKIEKETAFACPYWKRHPIKHLQCLYHGQKTTRHIKTHLTRNHRQPIHCPNCFRIFKTQAAQTVHIVERSCYQSSDPCPYGDGISNDQISEIDNLPRGGSEEDGWYRIWDVIFPLQERPASPYVDVEKFQQYIEGHYALKYSNLGRDEVENPKTNVYTSFLASRSTLQVLDENPGSGRPQRLPFLNFLQPSLHEASGPYQHVPLGTMVSPYKYSTHGNLSSTHPTTTPYLRTDISSTGPEYNVINYYYGHDGGHSIQDKGRDEEQARLASLNPAFPATDSGYASGFNADRFVECHPDHPTDHDTQTVYSEATIVPKAQAQQYVFDLCESIQSRLQHPISKKVPPSLSHSLPRILKAFAIRIGLESSSQINKTIMHFIHQHVR